MSAARAMARRHERFDAKSEQYLASGHWPVPQTIRLGPCRRKCPRRGVIFMPAGLCRKCLNELLAFAWAANQFGVAV